MDNAKQNIAIAINKYLDENKVSITKFASTVGVTPTSVVRWKDCVCAPDIELLPKLCEIMNISLPELFGMDSTNDLKPEEINVIKNYYSDMNFKKLVTAYLSDPKFKASIDYIIK